jgi:hypothetical protein
VSGHHRWESDRPNEGEWTVARVWRNVKADNATEAIERAQVGEHTEVRTGRQYTDAGALAQLYYTRDELETLQAAVGEAILNVEKNQTLARSPQIQALLTKRWTLLNSLRTSLAETRYGLMTRGEIDAEVAARAEAREAGIILAESWPPPTTSPARRTSGEAHQ